MKDDNAANLQERVEESADVDDGAEVKDVGLVEIELEEDLERHQRNYFRPSEGSLFR